MSIKPGTNYTVTKHSGIGGVTSVTKDPVSPTQIGRTHISAQTFTVPVSNIDNADFLVQGGHGLSTGDTLVYYTNVADSGSSHILKQSPNFAPNTNEVDLVNNILYSATPHGYKTGDYIRYYKISGSAIGGLADDTSYYVIKVNDNQIKVASSKRNAELGEAIPLTDTGHNDQLFFKYFQNGEHFFVRKKNDDEFYLHGTEADALAGANTIVITDSKKGNDSQTFSTSFGKLSPTVD